jgi:thiamine transport system substrate-binding protein
MLKPKTLRSLLPAILIAVLGPAGANAAPSKTAPEEVVVYAYDAFTGKGSLAELVEKEFARQFGGKSRVVGFSSVGEALNQVALEGKATKADLIVGIDEGLLGRARSLGAFEKAPADLSAGLEKDLSFDSEGQFVPFDYGYLTFVYDGKRTTPPAGLSLKDFSTRPEYKKSLAVQDPRTSSTGMSFLVWTRLAFGDGATAFWKALSDQILTIAPGWSGTYGLFLKGEAKFVVSYTTSPAYHIEKEKREDIRALIFPEGNYRQTEGAAVVRHSKRKELARKWIQTLLSTEVQTALPLHQWMYPARSGLKLPASFEKLPKVTKVLTADAAEVQKKKNEWLREWTSSAAGTRP